MKKAIHLQSINPETGNLLGIKQVPWCSVTMDNVKIVIEAYKNGIEPLENCIIEIVDGGTCYKLTADDLLKAMRFYIEYGNDKDAIAHYPNKFQYIIPDAIKVREKGKRMPHI